jgi:hypothetical protein
VRSAYDWRGFSSRGELSAFGVRITGRSGTCYCLISIVTHQFTETALADFRRCSLRAPRQLGFAFLLLFIAFGLPGGLVAESGTPTVDLSIYRHVNSIIWVTKNVDPVVDYWKRLGLKKIERTGPVEFPGCIYRGKPAPSTLKYGYGHIGDVLVEWVQPVTGTNIYTDFLKRHGDGVVALGYAVKSGEELERQIHTFQAKGVAVVQRDQWKAARGMHRVFLDTAGEGGGLTLAIYFNPDVSVARAAQISENDYPFNKLVQYAFVVHNVRKAGAYWQSLGFGGMAVDHNVSVDRFYRGQPARFEMDLGWQRFGDVPFEWVESTRGPNVYEEYVRDHGEGLHHLAVNVDNMDAAVKVLEVKGAPRSMWGGWDMPKSTGRFAYLDTEPHGGVTIELLWSQPK